jgi:hypothetical protein
MVPPIEQLTADGYDLQFGTNVVGPFYFTKLLLPTLISTAKSSPDGHARILATASSAHLLTTLNFNTFKDGPARKAAGPDTLYAQSKVVGLDTSVKLGWSTNYIYAGQRRSGKRTCEALWRSRDRFDVSEPWSVVLVVIFYCDYTHQSIMQETSRPICCDI